MRYIQKSYEEAEAENFPPPGRYYENWEQWREDNAWQVSEMYWSNGIWRINDDGSMECIATDGGEPEDNSFARDGAWIVGELNRAFENGFRAGYDASHEEMHINERLSP